MTDVCGQVLSFVIPAKAGTQMGGATPNAQKVWIPDRAFLFVLPREALPEHESGLM